MASKKYKIDWLNHSLEFLVVLIGILIAFQLNKNSIEKEQKSIVEIHITEIKKETEGNKTFFESAIKFDEANLVKMDTLFELIARKDDFTRINQLSLELLNMGGVYIRKNAYQTLVESGDIRFMKDFKVKQDIINLYEYYKWVEAFNEISNNLYSSDYYPYLKNNFDLTGGTTQPEKIYTTKIFKNILAAYYRTSHNRVKKYKDCLDQIDQYLSHK